MSRPRSSRAGAGLIRLVAIALLGAGCTAGPSERSYPPDDAVKARAVAAKAEADRPFTSDATKELELRLFLTEEGKLLVNAIRAHGGWDAWLSLRRVAYLRGWRLGPGAETTGSGGMEGSGYADRDRVELLIDPASFLCPCSEDRHGFHVGALPGERPATRILAEEHSFFALPFILVDPALRKEYAGVELDARTGEELEKLRVERTGSLDEEWMVLSFDRATGLLRRVLKRNRDGSAELTILSAWVEVSGVRTPARRETFVLRRPFEHRDLSRPDRVILLEAFETGR